MSEKEVFAAEWDDSGLGGTAREGCHSVGVESAAGNDMTGGQHWLGEGGRGERGRENCAFVRLDRVLCVYTFPSAKVAT